MSNASKTIENILFTLIFIAVIVFPWGANYLGVENNLSGAEEKVEFNVKDIDFLNKDFDIDNFHNKIDEYIIQNFPGRELLVRTKNQLMYSLFDVSPNNSIAKIGDTLYSTEALNYYYHGLHMVDESVVDNLISKLSLLNTLCKNRGKILVVVTTPTKPRYVNDEIPFADDIILAYQQNYGEKSYDVFKRKMRNTSINYFDAIDYIDTHKEIINDKDAPLFYKSGHHWSNYKGNLVGIGFLNFLKNNVGMNLPSIKVVASPSEVPAYPDADLFNVLNIYDKPNENFVSSDVSFVEFVPSDIDYLIQGGSFLGELLLPFITIGLNNKVIHIENKNCIYNNYVDNVQFEDYDDLDKKINLLRQLRDFDVIMLEINELNIYNASFGFIDYLLENERYF